MPKTLQYRAGSVIYFQGDEADKIYILQTGSINLVYQDFADQDIHDPVQPGEFFGVKSALGRYPREENAITLRNTTIMALTVPEFEALAMANIRIIMKMLKVFSNQLRRIHHQLSSLMEKEEHASPEVGLFEVGLYYLKNKRFFHARYIFSRYLTYYPSGKNAAEAAKYLEIAENTLRDKGQPGSAAAPRVQQAPPVAGKGALAAAGANMSATAKAYYDAMSLLNQEKYRQAYIILIKIVEADIDPEYVVKSVFDIGRCFFLMGKYDDCIQHFTGMITKYPKHPNLADALFFMGQSYDKRGQKDEAVTFYKTILSMSPAQEDITTKTKRALKAALRR
ncbi:MAG: cyclic nucleotide-binding domain-containing protein [Spirochaetaceae bacterium]|jgi:CRP-like cAMP-binding protein|nr:cyclic nucleotide-binding domain-containing protein [Spirochaetaceae bacterium]